MKNKKLVMIPGPTPVVRSIQEQMGRDTIAFGDPGFVSDFKDTLQTVKEMFHITGEAFILAGTGTLAMEMGIANIVQEKDAVLLLSNGFFGDRYEELCRRKRLDLDTLKAPWGQSVTAKELEEQMAKKVYKAVVVTHIDTSTGVCLPLEEIGEVVKKYPDTLLLVDGVCATAAIDEDMEKYGIDVIITGSQKAFGVAPGLAIVLASKAAMERRKTLGEIREYYADFDKWAPIMADPSKYFATPAVNMIWAFQESLNLIKEEGLQNRYERHIKVAEAVQEALEALGFGILADKKYRAVTLSNVLYMEGIDDVTFRTLLAEEGAVVAGGLAAYAGKMFRLGHMGHIDTHTIVSTLAAIERVLHRMGKTDVLGKGVKTFTEAFLTK